MCVSFYFVIVLALEQTWQLPYHQLIGLWTLGSLMVGVAALPAGIIADRFGAPRMMTVFFIGMGVCAIGAGFSIGTSSLLIWLTGIGLFAAIYHPVGIPWLVRNTRSTRGKALAVNGIFGSLGGAAAGIVSGIFIDTINWRAAFIVPGVLTVVTGLVMIWMLQGKVALDREAEVQSGTESIPVVRVFLLLMICMFISGLLFNGTQTALPKLFELRNQGLAGGGMSGIGLLVAAVYIVAGLMQLLGGHLADRYPLKIVYVGAIGLQIPLLWLAANAGGAGLIVVSTLMVVANVGALPAENMMLARYAPSRHHGLAFGTKFLVSFGAAPLAIQIVAQVQSRTGEFHMLFNLFAAFATLALITALLLPKMHSTVKAIQTQTN